jgi:putative spermidine/putrescine transport system ATP-binding protein
MAVAKGVETTIIVRPENVRRLRPDERICNELTGDLIETTFVGGSTRYYVRTDNGAVIVVRELTNKIPWSAAGEKVRIGWAAEHTLVIRKIPDQKISEG